MLIRSIELDLQNDAKDFLFPAENFFRKDNFQFSSRRFLPFPEIAYDAQTSL